MSVFLRMWAILVVAAKRLLSQRWLALATLLGLAISVALIMSIPLYADAVYYRILRDELSARYETVGGSPAAAARLRQRPPFAFMFRYMGTLHGSLEWEDVQAVDAYLSGPAGAALGLPRQLLVRHCKTENLRLSPWEDSSAYEDADRPLDLVAFAFVSDLENHVTILEGHLPAVATPTPDSTVEVMVSEPLATGLGLQVGETYAVLPRSLTQNLPATPIPVRIAGVWRATNPEEDSWFYDPTALEDLFFVPEETFRSRISPYVNNEVYLGLWYLVMDGSDVHASDVAPLLKRIAVVQQRVSALRPYTELDMLLVEALLRYQRAAGLLTILFYAFSVPIVGLLLAFISLVVGLSVGRQRNEMAVLRSRGATAAQVVGIAALEGLLLGMIALIVGTPVGTMMARVIGRARSFLDFTLQANLRVGVTVTTWCFGIASVGLALLAQLLPTIGAARHTIVTYKREQARTLQRPWWQRAWLDVLLFIPAAYGTFLLRQQGSIALPVAGQEMPGDPFQNPLLFLVPALGIFALTLFVLRLLPSVMGCIAWLSSRTSGVGVLLAARHLARTPGLYAAPVVLLVLTLSLSAFTASLAQTLDHHLYDQVYYQVGADVSLVEMGENVETGASGGPSGGGASPVGQEEGPRWLFLPVSEHLKVPGVRAAARVGHYKAITQLSGTPQVGTFMGIDRVDFAQVAFWRRDFAPVSLGELMNALATTPYGVLVSRNFLREHALSMGDTFRIAVDTYAQRNELDVQIVGGFDLFPGWYPEQEQSPGAARSGAQEKQPGGPLFVGNLDYLFDEAGGQFPYDVWLKTDPQADYEELVRGVRALGVRVEEWDTSRLKISKEQERPERQGLFGLLSVGFVAAALLTVLGFLLYAFFSFRRRFVELGVLRAIGLSARHMAAFLAWELAFLIAVGLAAGTGLGVWISRSFIPYLQVGAGPSAHIPPLVVEIAWPSIFHIYALFGLLFVAALGGLTALLLRIRIFQAIKLGETA